MQTVIEQLINPTNTDIAQLLMLFRKIPGRTCTAKNYLSYLDYGWRANIAVFVVREDNRIAGFTQAEAPGLLDPKSAFLPFTCSGKKCRKEDSMKALAMAEEWMRDHGATKYKFDTIRNPKALERAWGMKISDEIRMEKQL
jgi:hypothetical protein